MTGAIVLAAGYSSRMGSFKPLLDVGGEPSLVRAVRSVAAADETAVVTGRLRERLRALIAREGAVELYNPDYDDGMFSSVLTGIRYFAGRNADGVLLLPCDCPCVPAEVSKILLEQAGDRLAVPVYRGKKGHPLWIPASFFPEILAHDGTMGLKGVTLRHEEEILRVPVPYEGAVLDMDRPEDYERILSFASRPSLSELAAGRRFMLMRHGDTVPHAGKIFVGWYDVPLSEKGVEQARELAAVLSETKPEAEAVYTSELRRAHAAAEVIAASLGLPVRRLPGLNEIRLGSWDGRLIEDIKREFPAEYERRGRNLMTYKPDDVSECFFDLQYRCVSCLRDILASDRSRDILIVSHAGVIKCLYGNLLGRDIEWAFDRCRPAKGEYITVDLR